jgi:hypothetical protein
LGILAAAWLVFVLYAYPGIMSIDSFDQLQEARAWFFTDSHPPAMAALWGAIDHVVPGPFGLLAIQSACLVAGLFLILRRALAPIVAAACTSVVFLFPPIAAPMAVIWKDCLMAGFLVLGLGLVLDDRRGPRIAGLVALMLGTAMRYNAFAATLPLIVLLFEWRPGQRALVRYGTAVAAWIAITAAALGINSLLADRKMYFWASSFALVDIVGTLTMLDDDLPDSELQPLLAPTEIHVDHDFHEVIRTKYTPGDFSNVLGAPPNLWSMPINGTTPAPLPQVEAVTHAWRELVPAHPGAYLKYRFDTFAEVLGLRDKLHGTTIIPRSWQQKLLLDSYGIGEHAPLFGRVGERLALWAARGTPLFRPWIYACLALALLWMARRHRDVLALLLSGLAMEGSLLFLAVTPDYRYSHWLVVCTGLGLVLLVARRARAALP